MGFYMENQNVELIARMVMEALESREKESNGFAVPIGVSARHIHLTQEHVEILFGKGYQLTKKRPPHSARKVQHGRPVCLQ